MPGGLKQSASKEEFLKALKLNLKDPGDKQRFLVLWSEVTTYWNRCFESDDRRILKPEYANNAEVTRPYKWAHFSPSFIDQAIRDIWQSTSSSSSRYYYELGASEDKRVHNWVLKWLLWHVCRYRDWRNRKQRSGGKTIKLDANGFGNGDGSDCEYTCHNQRRGHVHTHGPLASQAMAMTVPMTMPMTPSVMCAGMGMGMAMSSGATLALAEAEVANGSSSGTRTARLNRVRAPNIRPKTGSVLKLKQIH